MVTFLVLGETEVDVPPGDQHHVVPQVLALDLGFLDDDDVGLEDVEHGLHALGRSHGKSSVSDSPGRCAFATMAGTRRGSYDGERGQERMRTRVTDLIPFTGDEVSFIAKVKFG